MMMLEFSIFPVGAGESLSEAVAEALVEVKRSGIPYEIGDMGTTVEGSPRDCLRLVERCLRKLARRYARISCSVKIDWRRGEEGRLGKKAEKVKMLLRRKGRLEKRNA